MNDRLVVDTDVVSFVLKNDTRAKLYEPHLNSRQLVVSFQTVAELYRWAAEKNWGSKRVLDLEKRLRQYIVCPVDPKLCQIWAQVMADGKRNGKTIQCADGWVAAAALSYGIPLVSHNAKHFAGVDRLVLITETESSSSIIRPD
jgi:tRNA(fMet)-specific endonuclease VapC